MISEIIKDKNIPREEFEKAKEKFDGKFDNLLSLGDEVRETLEYLRELGLPLAIVSSRTSSAIIRILEKMNRPKVRQIGIINFNKKALRDSGRIRSNSR